MCVKVSFHQEYDALKYLIEMALITSLLTKTNTLAI